MVEKIISVITLIPRSGRFYARQVQELFGDRVRVYAYSTGDQSVKKIRPSDLYLVSTDAFKETEETRQYVPSDGQVVEVQVTFAKKVIQSLKAIPKGTRVLFVNATEQMAREAVTQLEQLGVTQLRFVPYGPDSPLPEGVQVAVTPDETELVPPGLEQVINIGHRPCAPATMIEMAIRLEMESLLEELNLAEDQELYLTDGDRILLTNREELMDRSVEEIPGYERVVHGGIAMEKNSCMVSRLAENEDLEVIVRIREAGYQGALTLLGVMAALLGGMVFVTLGLSVFISLRLFQPIEKIMDALQSNRNILLGSEELFQEKDELTYILQTIQRTADVRKDVDKELAERVRLLKKAQTVALQSQINPHFLNNTMETINWTAIELLGGKNEISKMAGSLSKMLRMTLENSDTVVPVGEEIRHSMYYLEIQKIRYEDKFDVVWKIAPEVESCRIIRVVLQPLIENAIYHGIKPLTNKGLLTIRGYLNGETAELSVEDNGLGMTPEELNRLRENINGDVIKESAHIGLSNVNQRIRLYYGNEYGLIIDSREGIGTRVTIRFPRLQPSDPAAPD